MYCAQDHDLREELAQAFVESPEGREQVRFFAELPDSAVTGGYRYWWDQERLFEVADRLPVATVPVRDLTWVLDVQWRPNGLTMNELRCEGPRSPGWSRVVAADLRFPIVVAPHPHDCSDQLTVVDGYHRLLRAVVEGRILIAAVVLPACRRHEILHRSGFFGTLNSLAERAPDLLQEARQVAGTILERPSS